MNGGRDNMPDITMKIKKKKSKSEI